MKSHFQITKVTLLLTLFFMYVEICNAQQICDRLFDDGKNSYNTGDYEKAKVYFKRGQSYPTCKNTDWQTWINKCDEKIKNSQSQPQPSSSPSRQSPCDILVQQGIEKFNSNSYEEAKTFFLSARELNCSEADNWIRKCEVIEKQEKEAQCKSEMDNGEFYYNQGEYATALTYFEFASGQGCSGADIWVQRCKNHIKTTASVLNLTEIRRTINLNTSSNPTQSFDNGEYKGEVFSARRNGMGIYVWTNGTIYIGEFKNGFRSGKGIYIVPDGGYIVPNCPDCTFFAGEWENDKKKGTGFCYNETGKLIYSGNFVNDMPVDNYPPINNNSSYKFEIKEYNNGNKYLGETKNGKSNGLGIELDSNGDIKFGNWTEGRLNGIYIYLFKNGTVEKLNSKI